MFTTTIQNGESMFDAICRAGAEANRLGENGYMIICEKCGQQLDEEHTPEECKIILENR